MFAYYSNIGICLYSDDADKLEEVLNEEDPATPGGTRAETPSGTPGGSATALPEDSSVAKYLPFPSSSDLNTRIRRIITAYQKISRRKAEAAAAALEKVSLVQFTTCIHVYYVIR